MRGNCGGEQEPPSSPLRIGSTAKRAVVRRRRKRGTLRTDRAVLPGWFSYCSGDGDADGVGVAASAELHHEGRGWNGGGGGRVGEHWPPSRR